MALALAKDGDWERRAARVDLFHSPELAKKQATSAPFGADPFVADPFGADPFGGNQGPVAADPFAAGSSDADPFGGPVAADPFIIKPIPKAEALIEELDLLPGRYLFRNFVDSANGVAIKEFAERMKNRQQEFHALLQDLQAELVAAKGEQAREAIFRKIDANQLQLQELQILQLEAQLQTLRASLEAMKQPDAIKQRVDAKLNAGP